jgi:hypothetical protein
MLIKYAVLVAQRLEKIDPKKSVNFKLNWAQLGTKTFTLLEFLWPRGTKTFTLLEFLWPRGTKTFTLPPVRNARAKLIMGPDNLVERESNLKCSYILDVAKKRSYSLQV